MKSITTRMGGAHRDSTVTRPEEAFSLSSSRGGEGRGEEANSIECPSPRPSPRSFLAGRGRKILVVVSRCARTGNSWPLEVQRCVALLVILVSTPASLGANATATGQIINPLGSNDNTLRSLEENKQKQIQASKTWKVFHDFQFSDQYAESGISFEQHPVDDAAKNYK